MKHEVAPHTSEGCLLSNLTFTLRNLLFACDDTEATSVLCLESLLFYGVCGTCVGITTLLAGLGGGAVVVFLHTM